MKIRISILITLYFFITSFTDFKTEQLKNGRVRTAYAEKESGAKKLFINNGFDISKSNIYIRVFKHESSIELWARPTEKTTYSLIKTYPICMASGTPGPKRKQGDGQVPEGHYYINRFNPSSNFYLSLGINYPNASDAVRSNRSNPGGDIFIHGSCVTIGCMPITDNGIKELYLICVEAKNGGQSKIPVTIFPGRLSDTGLAELKKQFPDLKTHQLWDELKAVYDTFEKSHELPSVSIDPQGRYQISK